MNKIIREHGLEFIELFSCDTYVYLWSGHPLAKQEVISMEELDAYPCLSLIRANTIRFIWRRK